MAPAAEFRSLRAPQANGQRLVEPSSLTEVVAKNRDHLASIHYDLQGRSLAELGASARHHLLRAAVDYTSKYRTISTSPTTVDRTSTLYDKPFILSGHQPQLFHAGVWYKNFVLGRLASTVHGVGIHLVIDSDLCRSVSIRVPTGSVERPRVESVAYDLAAGEIPFEERRVRDEATFSSFGDRVATLIRPLVREPIVETLWPLMPVGGEEPNLGLRLARGRHALEEQWENPTLELPQSAVCSLAEFRWFIAHLLARLPQFWGVYNDALAAYRQAHRLRNRAHPVPDLTESDGWLEAPFWIWTTDNPRRRPLFARHRDGRIEITDRHALHEVLELSDDVEATRAVEQLGDLACQGWKIRTRALTTTLFARLLLGDIFLHGIGGAKYDQVTDLIARRFFGFALPEIAAVSATLRLPIAPAHPPDGNGDSIEQQLRALTYHPERFLDNEFLNSPGDRATARRLVDLKRHWIETPKTSSNAHERHWAIRNANEQLQAYVAPLRAELESRAIDAENRRRSETILRSREYSFCLFPRHELQRLVLDDGAQST